MKVLHIEAGRYLYGGARQVAYLIEGLDRLGVDNVLVSRPEAEIAAAVGAARVVGLPLSGDVDFGAVRRIERLIGSEDADIVHVHSRRGVDLFGGIAARRAGVPAVLTRRVDSREPAVWARLKYRPYAAIVAISSHIESYLRKDIGLEQGRVERIASAVDANRYRPDPRARVVMTERLAIPREAFVIGVVAQLIPRKGHQLLLESLREIVAANPDVQVLFFGRGPLEADLRDRVDELGLGAFVHMPGFREDLQTLMPGLDLLVHPAEREGLGVAVLEALACEVPVVASRAGGLVDVVRDATDGTLFAAGDAHGLTRAIIDMMSDESRRKSMGAMGRQRVCEHFSTAVMAERHRSLYTKILDGADGAE